MKIISKFFLIIGLIVIVLLALFFRIYGLETSPSSINFDEASLGYNAYSLLLTGRDEYGRRLPISLRSFNDYKPALYAYLSIPFVNLLGLNQTSTRMVSALFGSLALISLFLILGLFIKRKYLLTILLILAFQPWRLHFSRIAVESNLAAAFFTTGVMALLFYQQKRWFKLLAIVAFTLATFSYHSARLAVPILLILIEVEALWRHKIKGITKERIVNPGFFQIMKILTLIILLSLPVFLDKSSLVLTRLSQTNIIKNKYPFTPQELVEGKNPWLKLTANPIYYLGGLISGHFTAIISPRNLGTAVYDWIERSVQSIGGMGMLASLECLSLILGLLVVLTKLKYYKYRLLLYWLAAGVTPVVLTQEWFHPLRSLNALPALEIIVAIGMVKAREILDVYIRQRLVRNLAYLIIGLMFVSEIVFTINNVLVFNAQAALGEFQPGAFKEGAKILMELEKKYQTVYIDTPHAQSYIFFWFYQQRNPREVQSYANLRPKPGEGGKLDQGSLLFDYGKYVFKKFDWPEDRHKTNFVYWTSSEVKENEILAEPGTTIKKIANAIYPEAAYIITKD